MSVIRSFRHKGLKRLWQNDDPALVKADMRERCANVLAVLDAASAASDMDLPGYRLHKLAGNLKNHWSVTISGHWRITFRFEDASAFDVDLIDYH